MLSDVYQIVKYVECLIGYMICVLFIIKYLTSCKNCMFKSFFFYSPSSSSSSYVSTYMGCLATSVCLTLATHLNFFLCSFSCVTSLLTC